MPGYGVAELRDAEVVVPPPEIAPAAELPAAEKHTYAHVLKSSALIGSWSVLNIGIGVVCAEAMAVLLGPAGFRLTNLYGSIAGFAVSIAGMGVNSGGVRQIVEAAASGAPTTARTVTVLRTKPGRPCRRFPGDKECAPYDCTFGEHPACILTRTF
jgi:hypothetical protein